MVIFEYIVLSIAFVALIISVLILGAMLYSLFAAVIFPSIKDLFRKRKMRWKQDCSGK